MHIISAKNQARDGVPRIWPHGTVHFCMLRLVSLQMLLRPFARPLMLWGLHPLYWQRYRPNFRKLRSGFERIARHTYTRPAEEGSTAFWACVRRAFPNGLTDGAHWQRAVTSISLMYAAGSETTANAVGIILAALSIDERSRQKLEEVRHTILCVQKPLLRSAI